MNVDATPRSLADEDVAAASEIVPAIMRLLRVIRLRKEIVAATMGAVAVVGVAYYALATRYYASSAKLLIVQQNQDQFSTVGDHISSENTMATHRELVTSQKVLRRAIELLSPDDRVDLAQSPPREWVESLASRLSASTTRKTNFIDVHYRSRHPETAAAVVRAVIESYLQFVEETHKGAAGDVVEVLTSERLKIQQNLSEKQEELQRFRQLVGHLSVDPDDGVVEPIIQRAVHLNEALLRAQEKRLELQAALASVEGAIERGEDVNQHLAVVEATVGREMLLAGLGLSQQDMQVLAEREKKLLESQEELRSLAAFYLPNHPRMIDLQREVVILQQYLANYRQQAGQRLGGGGGAQLGAIVQQMLGQAVNQAQQREIQLQASFEEARTAAAQQSGDLVKLHMLEREVARLESLHDVLFDKIATVDIRQVQAPIQATVVRDPLPDPDPVSPQLRHVAVICLLGGLLLGCAIVVVLDVLDDHFKSPEELQVQLATAVLSMVRKLNPLEAEGLDSVHTHALAGGVEAEAFRTLRTSITLSGKACEKIVVSSSEPGDGKTTITANLAVAFAQAGKRTLVIDADLRKPGLTALLQLKRLPGLADILRGEAPVEQSAAEMTLATGAAGLDVIPAGLRRANPSELLSSRHFAELLAWAEGLYDQVIVDCPPVLAVSDAQIAGRLVDGAILVVRPDKNHRRMVLRAVESLRSTGCHLLGVVANGLSAEMSGYGYGYGYGYSYGDGYGHDSETADDDRPREALPMEDEFAARSVDERDVNPQQSSPAPIAPRRKAS